VLSQHQQRGATKAEVDADERAMAILKKRNGYYAKIDRMGYEAMPEEAYQRWLNSVNEATEENKHQNNMLKINEMLEMK
jgi:hypothetical protein